MSALRITVGLLLIVMGAVAVVTGDFGIAGGWLIAIGLGAIGIVGLVSAAASTRSETATG